MKNSKYLMLAAIAAATAMVSSCSDNGDLSTPTKEAEGKALVVNPTVLDSRVTPLAKSAFTGFKLYGVQNPTNGESVGSFIKTGDVSGVNYAGTFGSADAEVAFAPASGTVKWPTTNPDNSANFYGISVQGGADLAESGITVTEDGITDGTFSYTAPVDGDGNVDLSAQKDIMIASSLNATQSTDNGVVTLPFKHAFAKLTFQIRWNSTEFIKNKVTDIGGGITDYSVIWVDYIKFHNVKCNGTYSFTADDGKGEWTVNGENSTITFKYDTPRFFIAQKYTLKDEYLATHPGVGENDQEVLDACNANPFNVQDLVVGNDAIMIIPQLLNAWSSGAFSSTTGAFVEIRCLGCGISDDYADYITGDLKDYVESHNTYDSDQSDGQIYIPILFDDQNADLMGSIYFPIKLASGGFEFKQNQSYNFRLNIANCLQADGTKYLDSVGFDN